MNSRRPTLTLCMVARNEERNLPMSLGSVSGWVDSIILLDDNSRDDTRGIARRLGATVATVATAPEGFPEAKKNHAMSLADTDWVLILDADEVVTEESKKEIDALLARGTTHVAFRMPRLNYYFGSPLKHGGQWPDSQVRLVRPASVRYPGVGMHERLEVDGSVGTLDHPLEHHPYPTFGEWLRKWEWYTRKEAGVLQERGVPLNPGTIRHHMITRPLRRAFSRLFLKRAYRDGVAGLLAVWIDLMTHVVAFGRYWMSQRGLDNLTDEPEGGR